MYWFASAKTAWTMAWRIGVSFVTGRLRSVGNSVPFTNASSSSPVIAVPVPSSCAHASQRHADGRMDV